MVQILRIRSSPLLEKDVRDRRGENTGLVQCREDECRRISLIPSCCVLEVQDSSNVEGVNIVFRALFGGELRSRGDGECRGSFKRSQAVGNYVGIHLIAEMSVETVVWRLFEMGAGFKV